MIVYNFGDMKGGDFEERKGVVNKFHQQQFHQQQLHHHHQNSLAQKRECHSDEAEVDSRSNGGGDATIVPATAASDPKKQKKGGGGGGSDGGDGASIEVVRRPRGRPPGSKNKPKPPVVITCEAADTPNVMRPHVLEIPTGHDVVEALARFSRRRNLGLSVMACTGPVSNVTFRQPSLSPASPPATAAASTVTFHGRFEILSMSATFLPPSFTASSTLLPSNGGFSISLAGPQGQIVGGAVAGPLVAAGTVTVIAAAFTNPTFYRIPAEEELSVSLSVSGDGGGGGGRGEDVEEQHHNLQQQEHHHHHHHHHGGGGAPTSLAESPGMSIYSCHLPSDVIWAPTARTPHPPPY